MTSGSRSSASARWSAAGKELRRSSVRSIDSLTCEARANAAATRPMQTVERMSLARSGTPGCSHTAASAAKPQIAASAPDRGRRDSSPCSKLRSTCVSDSRDNPFEHAGLAGQREVQHPRADREREGDDRSGRRAFGNGGREQRDGADQQAVEQVAEHQVEGLRWVQMPAEEFPDRQRRERGNDRDEPGTPRSPPAWRRSASAPDRATAPEDAAHPIPFRGRASEWPRTGTAA